MRGIRRQFGATPRAPHRPIALVVLMIFLPTPAVLADAPQRKVEPSASWDGMDPFESEDFGAAETGDPEDSHTETGVLPRAGATGDDKTAGETFRRPPKDRRVAPRRGGTLGLGDGSADGSTPWYRSAIGSLMLVLALVAIAYTVVKRFIPTARTADSGLIRVVARAALSPKHSVALVQLGQRFVMIGVSPDRMSTITEIRDADEVGELAARAGTGRRTGQ